MSFLNPLGLIGLLALPAILGLHLLYRHKRRIVVSHLGLWAFLDAQARGPRLRRLPLSWLLLIDLLIGALLGLALAQPRLNVSLPFFNTRNVVILIDVSSSMLARLGPSSRIDQARGEALALLNTLGPQDTVVLVTFGRNARLLGDSRQDSFDQLSARIEGLQAGETGAAIRAAFALGNAALEGSSPAEFHVFTDGGFPRGDPGELVLPSQPVWWHFFNQAAQNLAVLNLSATPLDQNHIQIFARLANLGNRDASPTVSMAVDGRAVSSDPVEIPAGTSVTKVWQANTGTGSQSSSSVTVSLSGRDALPEDNSASIGLQTGGRIRVALVAQDPAPLQQAILAVPHADLDLIDPEDYNQPGASGQHLYDLTIFRGFIPKTWPGGQVLVVEPPEAPETTSSAPPSAGTLSLEVKFSQDIPAGAPLQFPYPDPLVSGVDFSGVRWLNAWSLLRVPEGFVPLLQVGNAPLLLRGQVDDEVNGLTRVYVLLADLKRGNFTRHPAFPILIANLVQNLKQSPLPPGVQSGEPIPLPNPGGYQDVQVFAPGMAPLRYTAEAKDWPVSWNETLVAGLYRFRFENTAGEVVEYLSGVNTGNEMESDLMPREWTGRVKTGDGEESPGSTQARRELGEQQIDLTPWLVGLAVLALLLEAALAWRPALKQS